MASASIVPDADLAAFLADMGISHYEYSFHWTDALARAQYSWWREQRTAGLPSQGPLAGVGQEVPAPSTGAAVISAVADRFEASAPPEVVNAVYGLGNRLRALGGGILCALGGSGNGAPSSGVPWKFLLGAGAALGAVILVRKLF